MLYLKLSCSPSSNKPSPSSLLAFSIKYSAKCKHCYVCLCAMAGFMQALPECRTDREPLSASLEPGMFLFTNPGARQGPLLEACCLLPCYTQPLSGSVSKKEQHCCMCSNNKGNLKYNTLVVLLAS